jgi:hypothetical protein
MPGPIAPEALCLENAERQVAFVSIHATCLTADKKGSASRVHGYRRSYHSLLAL